MDEKIQGKGRTGDFIHDHLEMAKDQGHKCVSKIWYDKTISIDEGLEKVASAVRSRDDILTEFRNMFVSIDNDDRLCVEHADGRTFLPTPYAWKKILVWHNMPTHWVEFLSTDQPNDKRPELTIKRSRIDAEIALALFNRQRKSVDANKQFLYRTYDDGTLRTMVSDRYSIIDNGWYLQTLKELFQAMGKTEEPRLSHWRGDEDTIYGNLLIPDTVREEDDSDYGGMISMSNCEVGKRVFSQYPSVFRAICCNGCIWDHTHGNIIKRRHVGDIDLAELREMLAVNIHRQIPLLEEGINRFLATKEKVVANDVPLRGLFATLAQVGKFSFGLKGQANAIVSQYTDHEADNRNLFGVVNAITRAGQLYSADEWVRFDEFAGDLVNFSDKQWDALQMRSKAISEKEMEKVFGAAV